MNRAHTAKIIVATLLLSIPAASRSYSLPFFGKKKSTPTKKQDAAPAAPQAKINPLEQISKSIDEGVAKYGDSKEVLIVLPLDALLVLPDKQICTRVAEKQMTILQQAKDCKLDKKGQADQVWHSLDKLMVDEVLPHVRLSTAGKELVDKIRTYRNVHVIAISMALLPNLKPTAQIVIDHLKTRGIDFADKSIAPNNAMLCLEEEGTQWLRYQSGICFLDLVKMSSGAVSRSLAKRNANPLKELMAKAGYTPAHTLPNIAGSRA